MFDHSITFERLAVELASALAPLSDALDSSESLLIFFQKIGWELPEETSAIGIDRSVVDAAISALEHVINLQSAPIPDPDVVRSKYVNLTVSVAALIAHIYNAQNEIANHLGQAYITASNIRNELPKRVFDYLVIRYMKNSYGLVYHLLITLGIFELKEYQRDAGTFTSNHTRHVIHFHRILYLFGDLNKLFNEVYGWGTPEANLGILMERLYHLFILFGFPVRIGAPLIEELEKLWSPVSVPTEGILEDVELQVALFRTEGFSETETVAEEAGVSLLPIPATDATKGLGLAIIPFASGVFEGDIPLGETSNLFLKLVTNLNLASGIGFIIRPQDDLKVLSDISGSGALDAKGSFTLELRYQVPLSDELFSIINIPNVLNLAARGFYLRVRFVANSEGKSELAAELGIEEGNIRLSPEGADSFIKRMLPSDGIEVTFDLGLGWSTQRGIYLLAGSGNRQSGFDKSMAIGKTIGPLTLSTMHFSFRTTEDAIEAIISISGNVKFGPLEVSIEKVGVISKLENISSGELLGILDSKGLLFKFKPPDGLGIALDTNGVKGGGFIWKSGEEYSGIIDLDIRGFSVQAVALLDTRDTSVLFAIFSSFRTPIQLGAGWKITKIGGLIGINRTVSLNDIASGFRSGILDSILFPENVIENAPRIINDFKRVFPANSGQHLIGPAIRIAYGTPTLITGDIAIILEFPNPFQLSLIGRIRARIPDEKHPVVQINLAVLGAIDFTNERLGIYGSLYDSRILDFALSGDVAIAASWGPEEKNFIMSLGGFNPRFSPPSNFPPFNAPPLKRLSVALSNNVRLECYLALTSNTLQIGARIDAVFKNGDASISGFLAFDTLIQFDPLYYVVDVAAGFSVRFRSYSLASIMFSGFIEGPNPHRIKGSLTFSILWLDFSVDVDKTFGDQKPESFSVIDPWFILKEALEQNDSWTAELPNWDVVGVVTGESSSMKEGDQMIQPLGTLGVSQKVVPLNHTLTKFGSSDPIENFRFEIISMNDIPTSSLVSTQDYFAPAQFTEYDNSEKLTLKSYDLMDSGVFFTSAEKEVAFSVESASYKEISYETIVLENIANKEDIKRTKKDPENDRFFLNAIMSQTFLLAGAAYSTSVANSHKLKYGLKTHVKDSTLVKEKFVIVDEDENMAVREVPTLEGEMSQSVAINRLKDYKKANPQDKRNLNVVSTFELVEVAA